MTLLKKMMLAASLFLVSNFASAAVYNLGTGLNLDENIGVPSTQLVVGTSSAGLFADFFNFTLTDDSIFSQELLYSSGFTALGFSVVEFGTNNIVGSAITTGANTLDISNLWLSAGDYTTNVLGLFDGGFGAYSLTSSVSPISPVPEASTIAMMLGGLGLVGFMAARRRKTA